MNKWQNNNKTNNRITVWTINDKHKRLEGMIERLLKQIAKPKNEQHKKNNEHQMMKWKKNRNHKMNDKEMTQKNNTLSNRKVGWTKEWIMKQTTES